MEKNRPILVNLKTWACGYFDTGSEFGRGIAQKPFTAFSMETCTCHMSTGYKHQNNNIVFIIVVTNVLTSKTCHPTPLVSDRNRQRL